MISGLEQPSLHKIASNLSDLYQSRYLLLVKLELSCLFIASVLALNFSDTANYYLISASFLLCGLVVLLSRSIIRPEQSWYRARAVAESIKTSCWRYSMLAHPYNDADARKRFLSFLRELLNSNQILTRDNSSPEVQDNQITDSMESLRNFPLYMRVDFYMLNRVGDQRAWYISKAKSNRRAFKIWIAASITAYAAAIFFALSRIAHPNWKFVPVDPLIVLASSFICWIQLKKHAELASSYTLTATEIGFAAEERNNLLDESDFSNFVNDAELAFSREHTQWVARQQTSG